MTKTRCAKWLALLACAIGFVAFCIDSKNLVEQGDRASAAETHAMFALSALARDMIAEGGSAVRGTGDHRYIASFAAFYEYVARTNPHAVSSPDAPNPFPGLLPGKHYNRLSGLAKAGGDVLLQTDPRQRHFEAITNDLYCDGMADTKVGK